MFLAPRGDIGNVRKPAGNWKKGIRLTVVADNHSDLLAYRKTLAREVFLHLPLLFFLEAPERIIHTRAAGAAKANAMATYQGQSRPVVRAIVTVRMRTLECSWVFYITSTYWIFRVLLMRKANIYLIDTREKHKIPSIRQKTAEHIMLGRSKYHYGK